MSINLTNGWFNYKGNCVLQNENVKDAFEKLFINKKPKRILEIGTAFGGLTVLLRDTLNELSMHDTIIRTYDVHEKHYIDVKDGIDIRIENIFNEKCTDLNDLKIGDVLNFIKDDGVTIILCDGGNKKNEFNILSKYMKVGDILMAHDYSPNEKFFIEKIKSKVWNWMEIEDIDIEESVLNNKLTPYMFEEFVNVAWVCKEKNN